GRGSRHWPAGLLLPLLLLRHARLGRGRRSRLWRTSTRRRGGLLLRPLLLFDNTWLGHGRSGLARGGGYRRTQLVLRPPPLETGLRRGLDLVLRREHWLRRLDT